MRSFTLLLILLQTATGVAAEVINDYRVRGFADLRLMQTDNSISWLDEGLGKNRYGGNNSSDKRTRFDIAEAALEASAKFGWTWSGHGTFKYDPDQKNTLGILESYLRFRPRPTSSFRFNSRLGAFFPPVSLENSGVSWTSPYTLTPSAINSWIGEEVRVLGAELTVEKSVAEHRLGLSGSLYKANDPAGSLLAFRGWTLQDRKLTLNDRVPLAPVASIQPGGVFQDQAPWVEPFKEIDDRWGFYTAGRWRYLDTSEVRAIYYNNRGNAGRFDGDQYAWRTRFVGVGSKINLGDNIDLLAQYMEGTSKMGKLNGQNMVDINFSAFYLLASKRIGRHRLSVRFDKFKVDDKDSQPLSADDINTEDGHAWTLAYSFRFTKVQQLTLDTLYIDSDRPARVQTGSTPNVDEWLTQLSYRILFSRRSLQNRPR